MAPVLSVGNFPAHAVGKIRADDTADRITTTVKEKRSNEIYEVEVHFEFRSPDRDNVRLCEGLDAAPYHIVLNRFALDGKIADRRIIRNGEGHSRTQVTEEEGIIKVDITVRNVSGIQMMGPV